MLILAVGLNHRTAPVEIRERLSVPQADLEPALDALKAHLRREAGWGEGVLVSTCNRTEVYAAGPWDDAALATASLAGFLASRKGLSGEDFGPFLYSHVGLDAARHLFRVASGLDAMLLGETQVLGQVREAYLAAHRAGSVGKVFHAMFRQALAVARRVHAETEISHNAVSVPYAAVELARRVFGRLDRSGVLVVGAGKMAELTVKNLLGAGSVRLVVCNRTRSRAEDLAAAWGGTAAGLDELPALLESVDVVITSTDAPETLLDARLVERALARRRGRPLFIVDIAVPRDVAPEVGQLDNVFLYDIDDLEAVVAQNLHERRKAAELAEAIMDEEVERFRAWLNALDVVPLIRSLREQAHAIRRSELEEVFRRLPELGERERQIIEAMTVTMVNKFLNVPTLKLKEFASEGRAGETLQLVRRLFGLDQAAASEAEPEAGRPAASPVTPHGAGRTTLKGSGP